MLNVLAFQIHVDPFIAMEEKVINVSRITVAFDFNCTATIGLSNLGAMPKDWCHRKYCNFVVVTLFPKGNCL